MKFSTYSSYKETDIGWLGNIPSSWDLKKIKYTLRENQAIKNSSLQSGSISFGEVVTKDDDSIPMETKNSYQEVKVGEFLINPINLNYDLKSLRTALSQIDVCVSPAYIVARLIDDGCDKSFLKYLLHQFDVAHMKTLGAGVRQTITFNDIGDNYWPLPSLEEQKTIANFLDVETTRIDELVQKQEKLIELLELKRQVVVYDSVTKGLNKSEKFKNSNIAWIGSIPSHWVTGKVKNYFQVTLGKMLQNEPKKDSDKLVKYLRAANIQTSGVDISDVKEMWLSENELNTLQLREGDILVSEGGDVGRCCIWNAELEECYFQNSINRVRPIGNQSNKFFYYWMTYAKNTGYIDILCNKSTIAHLTAEKLSALPMVFPPFEEQIKISCYLDSMFAKFDALISKSELSISLLKEYRASLISAAVTGKVDVKGLG